MLIFIIYICIGSQLLLSALAKLRHFHTFVSIFKTYSFPIIFKNNLTAGLVIIFEILLGISLLSLNVSILRFGVLGLIFFIISANILILIRLLKGEKKIRCGCGEFLDEEHNVFWLLIRNFALIIILLFCLSEPSLGNRLISQKSLFVYLAGIGLLSVIKLAGAVFKAIFAIKQWKLVG
jgi:Methylamine utilisation protein MauE